MNNQLHLFYPIIYSYLGLDELLFLLAGQKNSYYNWNISELNLLKARLQVNIVNSYQKLEILKNDNIWALYMRGQQAEYGSNIYYKSQGFLNKIRKLIKKNNKIDNTRDNLLSTYRDHKTITNWLYNTTLEMDELY